MKIVKLVLLAFMIIQIQPALHALADTPCPTKRSKNKYKRVEEDPNTYKCPRRCRDKIVITNKPGLLDEIGARMSARVANTSVIPPE